MSLLNSATIERAILYCGGDFASCEIYKRRMLIERQRKSGPGGDSGSSRETPEGRSPADPSDEVGPREKGGIRCGKKS